MKKILTDIYNKENFNPGLIGLFINPFYFSRKGLYKKIKSLATELEGKLLDFGCGSKPYKELFSVKEYIGVDVEKSGHSHEAEEIDVYYDGKSLPFEDESFDSIFSSEVFEHIFNLSEIITELHRVLKPGGKMLVTVPLVWDEHEAPFDFGRYTSFGIKSLLESKGLKVIKFSKSTTYIQTLFQLVILYSYRIFEKQNKYVRLLLLVPFVFPLNLFGSFLSLVLPNRDQLYVDNILIVQKGESIN